MTAPYYEDDLVTLYHGDCREALAEAEDRSVDCVITDPPFSDRTHEMTRSNSQGAKRHGNRVLSGSFGFDSVTEAEVSHLLSECGRITRRWVVANVDYRHAFAFHDAPPEGLRLLRIGVWVKTNPNPQISGDRPAQGWESIAYMHRTDLRPAWNGGGRAANFILGSDQRTGHPTSKPLAMVSQFVRWFTETGDTIWDPCVGSGTTLLAAKNEGRRATGWEIREDFCEIAARRLAQDTLFGGDAA